MIQTKHRRNHRNFSHRWLQLGSALILCLSHSITQAAIIASQSFDSLASDQDRFSGSLTDGSKLTNGGSFNLSSNGLTFESHFFDTRSGGPATGSDSDRIGTTHFTGSDHPDLNRDGQPFAVDGDHYFALGDTDGRIELTFEPLSLTGYFDRWLELDLWINPTGYESSDVVAIELLNSDSRSLLGEWRDSQLEDSTMAGQWNLLRFDLEPIIATLGDSLPLQLRLSVDTNANSEVIGFDNVLFGGSKTALSVPEPSTIGLLSLSLILLITARHHSPQERSTQHHSRRNAKTRTKSVL